MSEYKTNIIAEKLKIAMVKKNDMKVTELAKMVNCSPSNISNKFKRNNFSESDLRSFANALGYDVQISLVSRDTGEII